MEKDRFEEEGLKDLFNGFEPDLSSDALFMSKLQRNLDSVELIHRHNAELRIRSRISVVIAGVAGFIIGFLFSLVLPYLGRIVGSVEASLPPGSVLSVCVGNYLILAWGMIGGITVLTAYNVYDLSLFFMKRLRMP